VTPSLLLPLLLAPVLSAPPAAPPPAPVKVMFVGVFHMANPGHDLHNLKVDDVLAPKRQAEIAALTSALARFKPTAVAAEWPANLVAERYPQYLAGTLPPSRNETVQLAFRLAAAGKLKSVHGIDVDGDFPFPAVEAYAKANGKSAVLEEMHALGEKHMKDLGQILAEKSVSVALRSLNDPAHVNLEHAVFYRGALRVGAGNAQPGVDLLSAWYKRNFLICANLIQVSRPGDRIVVFYGAGHAFLLRQCVQETPGFELVEANDFLPQ